MSSEADYFGAAGVPAQATPAQAGHWTTTARATATRRPRPSRPAAAGPGIHGRAARAPGPGLPALPAGALRRGPHAGPQYAQAPPPGPYAAGPYAGQTVLVAPKNAGLALVVSCFLPGAGPMMNDQAGVGVAILVLYILGRLPTFFLIGIPIMVGPGAGV